MAAPASASAGHPGDLSHFSRPATGLSVYRERHPVDGEPGLSQEPGRLGVIVRQKGGSYQPGMLAGLTS